jgi:hypothetical protein
MKTIARKRSKVKKKASSKKTTARKTARRTTKKASKKAAKKVSRKVATVKKNPLNKVKAAKKRPIQRAKVAKKTAKKAAKKTAKKAKRASDITRKPAKKKAVIRKAPKRKAPTRKATKRKVTQRRSAADLKKLDAVARLTELVRQQRAAKVGKKHIARAGKKKGTRKVVTQTGPLRAMVERSLSRPMAQAQMYERLEEKVPGFFVRGEEWVETEESIIIQRLAMAEQLGVFDEEARENALEFDWDLRDVYELWHSPDVYF